MKTAKLKYYKGRKPCALCIENNAQGLYTLRDWIFSAGFARKDNQIARANVDKLTIWLDGCYCSWDAFTECLLNDVFVYDGQLLKNLIILLLNENCKGDADFNALEII